MAEQSEAKTPWFTLIWTIENIYPCMDERYVECPPFVVNVMDRSKWTFQFRLLSRNSRFSYKLSRNEGGLSSIKVDVELSILPAGADPIVLEILKDISFKVGDTHSTTFSSSESIEIVLKQFLPDGNLSIRLRMWQGGADREESEMCFARSRIAFYRRTFMWPVEFSNRSKCAKTILWQPNSETSPAFILAMSPPSGNNPEAVDLQVTSEDRTSSSITSALLLILRIQVVDSSGKGIHTENKREHWFYKHNQNWTFSLTANRSALTEERYQNLSKNVLNLKFDCWICTGDVRSQIETGDCVSMLRKADFVVVGSDHFGRVDGSESYSCSWKDDFRTLQEEEVLCDVLLRVDTSSFPAHKAILSARSPVFKTMFMTQMRESASGIVNIADLDAATVGRMLKFVYTDEVEDLTEDMARQLYYAADKYRMESLKRTCSRFFKSKLSVSNACSLLAMSDEHDDRDLKKSIQLFVVTHDAQIVDSNEWERLKRSNPQLVIDTMHEIYLKYSRGQEQVNK